MMEENSNVKNANLNRSQGLIHIVNANVTYFAGPRASGKTSGGIAPRLNHLSEVMPRAQIGLVSDKYERIHKVLLPSIEQYLNDEMGLKENVDYVKFRKPPDHFTKPIFPISQYDQVWSFASGVSLCMISLSVSGSANGYNLQALIGDEAKFFDEGKLKNEVFPAIRGGRARFGHLAEFQSKWFFTDKWGANIQWVLNKRNDMDKHKVDIVYALQLEVYRLKEEMQQYTSSATLQKYKARILEIEKILVALRKDLTYFCDALPYENLANLGEKYFRDLKRDLTQYEYEVAIENQDPDRTEKPFYPNLGKQHYFKGTYQFNPNRSLIIALDYQFAITPIGVAQWDKVPGRAYTTLTLQQSLHTLHPEGMEAALDKFSDLHKDHPTRHVYYVYDHTAIGRKSTGKPFNETVIDYLTVKGWNVTGVYMGEAPDHAIKYKQIQVHLQNQADGGVMIEEDRNRYMIKALKKTSAKMVSGQTKKDKSSETDGKTPPEESTHYPDVFDQLIWACCELNLVPMADQAPMSIRIGGR